MQKEVNPGVFIGAIAVVVLIAGFFVYRAIVGNVSSAPSDIGGRLMKVMERTGGDVNKMTPDEKKVYDEAVKTGYYRPGGSSGHMSSSGGPNVPGYGGPSPGASGYSSSSGYNSGNRGNYPGRR
jgi:hypothetical protein